MGLIANYLRWRTPRRYLPSRRENETFRFEHQGHKWLATISPFSDGTTAEIFLSTAKTGEFARYMANDAAIAASLALQYGCPEKVLRAALSRDTGGEPHSPLAAALDFVARFRGESMAEGDGVKRGTDPILQEHGTGA